LSHDRAAPREQLHGSHTLDDSARRNGVHFEIGHAGACHERDASDIP